MKKKYFFGIFFDSREYRKFVNPEREYRIPEIPVPGKFGNTVFPKNSHSRTSVFPKEKKSGMAPPLYVINVHDVLMLVLFREI